MRFEGFVDNWFGGLVEPAAVLGFGRDSVCLYNLVEFLLDRACFVRMPGVCFHRE